MTNIFKMANDPASILKQSTGNYRVIQHIIDMANVLFFQSFQTYAVTKGNLM